MTENSEEIAELKRAHTALATKMETILPTLATKADLEAMARHLTEEMSRRFAEMSRQFGGRFDEISHRFDGKFEELNRRMSDGFNSIWRWIAGSLVILIIALLGLFAAVLRQPYVFPPAAPAQPAVVNHFYPELVARPQSVAPPSQP